MLTFMEEPESEYWKDGMRYVYDHIKDKYPHIAMAWGGSSSRSAKCLSELRPEEFEGGESRKKKVWFYAGGSFDDPIIHTFDLVFCEDAYSQREFRKRGVNAKIAFGINTEVYHKMQCAQTWDYIYPAAFAQWKRHDLFVSRVLREKAKGLCVGRMQDHERYIYDDCREKGMTVIPMCPPHVINWLYNQSRVCYIPAEVYGGGQRACWEAKYIGLEVVVENERLQELLGQPVKTEKEYLETVVAELDKL